MVVKVILTGSLAIPRLSPPWFFSLIRPLFFTRPLLPRAWNRLILSPNHHAVFSGSCGGIHKEGMQIDYGRQLHSCSVQGVEGGSSFFSVCQVFLIRASVSVSTVLKVWGSLYPYCTQSCSIARLLPVSLLP